MCEEHGGPSDWTQVASQSEKKRDEPEKPKLLSKIEEDRLIRAQQDKEFQEGLAKDQELERARELEKQREQERQREEVERLASLAELNSETPQQKRRRLAEALEARAVAAADVYDEVAIINEQRENILDLDDDFFENNTPPQHQGNNKKREDKGKEKVKEHEKEKGKEKEKEKEEWQRIGEKEDDDDNDEVRMDKGVSNMEPLSLVPEPHVFHWDADNLNRLKDEGCEELALALRAYGDLWKIPKKDRQEILAMMMERRRHRVKTLLDTEHNELQQLSDRHDQIKHEKWIKVISKYVNY